MAVEQVEQGRVGWIDVDASRRIHHGAVLRWAEAAEASLMRRLGLIEGWSNMPRVALEVEYKGWLRFDDPIETRLRVDGIGRTSVRYVWEILREGEVAARGATTAVKVDDEGRPTPIPPEMRALLGG